MVASAAAPAAGGDAPARPSAGLTSLVGLAAERLLLADKVAAAKFGTTTPIEDPVREQQVLDRAAPLAVDAGVDPEVTVEFFRAQIEMNKVVQRGLYDVWTRHPERAPTERPDLATEVRPELDRIAVGLVSELAATQALRGPTAACRLSLLLAGARADRTYRLDPLHERALWGATAPVCAAGAETPGTAAARSVRM